MKHTDRMHAAAAAHSFLIHPAELQSRRRRCEPVTSRLLKIERQMMFICNVCGSLENAVVSAQDRYGLPLRTAICLNCGLIYLMDRFTDEGYSQFYEQGEYRNLLTLFSGAARDIAQIDADQHAYAKQLIRFLDGFICRGRARKLLDVGGSAGRIALALRNHFQMSAMVIDPAAKEIEAARAVGLKAVVGSIETWGTDDKFDLILLCRSIEHLSDLTYSLRKIHALLEPGGLFYCDILDFIGLVRVTGPAETVTKVDHCFWLTQESAPAIFRSVGFEIVSCNMAFRQPVGYLLRAAAAAAPIPSRTQLVGEQIRFLQQIAAEWEEYGHYPANSLEWLRRKAYRIKRGIVKLRAARNGS
ncbi:MAG: class I SAM-dependent methyltransferase [Bryobacteraceae bacterium]